MDVGEWLRSLGLGEYEEKFRDNKIDADVLADLTDGDLEKLGLPLGDRKRLRKAIADLVELPSAATKTEPAPAQLLWPRGPAIGFRRTPPDHRDVLRSRGLDRSCGEARRGRLAQLRQRLSR
jgi:hypothetical protein